MNWIKDLFLIRRPEAPSDFQRTGAAVAMSLILIVKFIWFNDRSGMGLFGVMAIWFLLIFKPKYWGLFLQTILWAFLNLFHWISVIALTVIFALIFSTVGFWRRRKGWDPMRWKLDPATVSYREEAEVLREGHFLKPF